MTTGPAGGSGGGRLVTKRFALVVAPGLAYFLALGVLLPVVPRYVEDVLGGGAVAVGVAVGALFVGAVLIRPAAGRLGDRIGRRVLIVGGAIVVSASVVCYGLVHSLVYLVAIRLVSGVGEAAFFVGAATMVTDLAPADRRGEAISYWSVAVYGGMALGPAIGDGVLDAAGSSAVWFVSGGLAGLAAILGSFTREVDRSERAEPGGPLVNRAAVGPGVLLFLGLVPLAAFMAFLPLYVEDSALPGAATVFLLYGALVLAVRIFGARLPDRLGPRRAGVIALAGAASGMVAMAAWGSTVGLLLGTVLFAAGMSLQYPALLLMALAGAPETERASVVGTFSSFFDLSQGLGSVIVGGVAAVGGYRGAFGVGAVSAGVGLVIVGLRPARRERAVEVAEAGALVAEHPAQ